MMEAVLSSEIFSFSADPGMTKHTLLKTVKYNALQTALMHFNQLSIFPGGTVR